MKLLETVDTGPTSSWKQEAKQYLNAVGFDVQGDPDYEELQTLLGQNVREVMSDAKGAMSENELKQFLKWSANMNKTPQGNRQIIDFSNRAAKRSQKLSREISKMRKNKSSEEIGTFIHQFRAENPLEYPGGETPEIGGEIRISPDGKYELKTGPNGEVYRRPIK
jgi:hypothetical protein